MSVEGDADCRFGGGGDDWDDDEAGVGPEGPSGGDGADDAAMAVDEGSEEERTPVPEEEGRTLNEQGGAEGEAAGPSRARRQPPVSCNKRLKREFRARKSLAGAAPTLPRVPWRFRSPVGKQLPFQSVPWAQTASLTCRVAAPNCLGCGLMLKGLTQYLWRSRSGTAAVSSWAEAQHARKLQAARLVAQ